MVTFLLDRVENIVENGENAGHQHFPFSQCFQKASFPGSLKVSTVVKAYLGSYYKQ